MLENLLTVYARAGLTDKSLELVKRADLKAASYTEALGETKTISFYDVAALGDLAAMYRQASVRYLEKAAADAQIKPTADYYLGAAYAEAGEGRKIRSLNIALGRLYLLRGDYGRAVTYLEAGRDKSNKNRIESNDPVMLVKLAAAYYRGRQFSESLEIYFEMSKHFPVVRRIQEALQGMYAMEHKSAGDVKIF
jgi:tetratricopeptide (TPR) repeat protein